VSSFVLVKINFYGDKLEAVEEDGKVWASLIRFSDNLGIDPDGQRCKLKDKAWATIVTVTMVAEDGKQREVTMIDLDTLPGCSRSTHKR